MAVRLWLPDDAVESPVPAVLEAHPYRKSDCTAPTDESRHRYTAEHGYAADVAVSRPGFWEFRVIAARGTERFTAIVNQDAPGVLR